MSDARTGNKCTMYQAGHQVHWIQVIGSSLPRNPRQGRIVSIRRGVITVDVDGQERTYTNHATRDLRAFVEKLGSFVVVDEPRSLLKVPLADGSLKCFSIADAGKPLHRCRFDQLPKFDLEALAKRTATHGGFDVPAQLLREHLGASPRGRRRALECGRAPPPHRGHLQGLAGVEEGKSLCRLQQPRPDA